MASVLLFSRLGAGRAPALVLALGLLAGGPAAADLTVVVDQAKLVRLPEKVATIVVGNPLIADVSMQAGGIVVITGKGYGVTNLIALDRSGNVLVERALVVERANASLITVYRGVERATYSCTPECEPRITLGDGKPFFDLTINQTMLRNSAAQASATQAK